MIRCARPPPEGPMAINIARRKFIAALGGTARDSRIAQRPEAALQSTTRRVNPMEENMTYLQRREVVFGLAGVALAPITIGRAGTALAADKIKPGASSALIVVDVQNCFLPGGSLAVKDGDQV